MARYTDSVCKLCRREGTKLYLKGERCFTDKCAMERRPYPPGQHGQARRKKTEYAVQLREKQKIRRAYGLVERQFRNYFKRADRMKGLTGENLLQLLERRLDNTIYRAGFAVSRRDARQLVVHGHVLVNGRKTNIPSFQVRINDVIELKPKALNSKRVKNAIEVTEKKQKVQWLKVDPEAGKVTVTALPVREDITDFEINEQLVVELYSK